MRSRLKRLLGWLAALTALLIFASVAALPHLTVDSPAPISPAWVTAAKRTAIVPLAHAPVSLTAVQLSPVARAAHPDAPPASLPALDSTHMAALVSAEDLRLRTLLRHASLLILPVVIPLRSGAPTLVLPGRPAAYTATDLQNAGALARRSDGEYTLVDSVLIASGATLQLGGSALRSMYMDSSPAGFTSLVTWGGTLTLAGDSPEAPLAITGWDHASNQPAADQGNGRPYIRAVGGRLELRNVRASNLGFWSGRTGGVAWTGISGQPATGGAASSTFTNNTYGAFVSRGEQVKFSDDLFEANELDGVRLHRNALHSTITGSTAARNGGNGFVVSRGATGSVLRGNLSVRNRGNGFLLNGQPLVNGASPSGNQALATVGTILEGSDAENNARTGILIEGGAGTVIRNNIVCATVTGVAVRAGASETMVVGNYVRCGGRIALSIGPSVTGTTVAGNTLQGARIGMLVRNSPGVRIMDNLFVGMSLFGISVRGSSPGVVGNDNVISGRGFNPIDTRGGATTPLITNTNVGGWQRRSELTALGYLRYHPVLSMWVAVMVMVAISTFLANHRRRPPRPYYYTVPWRSTAVSLPAASNGHVGANGSRAPGPRRPVRDVTPRPAWIEPPAVVRSIEK